MLGMTVAELRRRMTSKEFEQWNIYLDIDPCAEDREDRNHAELMQIYTAAHTDGRRAPPDVRDFMHDYVDHARKRMGAKKNPQRPPPSEVAIKLKQWLKVEKRRQEKAHG